MAGTSTLKTAKLTPFVGAEVLDVDRDRLVNDQELPSAVLDALEEHGVLLFRELHLDDETQAAFCHTLGDVGLFPDHPVPEIYEVSYNPGNPYAKYSDATFEWHLDGTIDEDMPVKATILTAKVLAGQGGETEFASTYAGYDSLSDDEKERCAGLRVVHTMASVWRRVDPKPLPGQLEEWAARGGREHPLVWTHESGRRSLVVGASADHITGMDAGASRDLLDDLLERTTTPDRVFRHSWSVGDMVIWDNCGLVHRALRYDRASGRRMHRSTILGTEAIR